MVSGAARLDVAGYEIAEASTFTLTSRHGIARPGPAMCSVRSTTRSLARAVAPPSMHPEAFCTAFTAEVLASVELCAIVAAAPALGTGA